jgi:hypothetical protein
MLICLHLLSLLSILNPIIEGLGRKLKEQKAGFK